MQSIKLMALFSLIFVLLGTACAVPTPSINITLVSPSGPSEVIQNQFFNYTINVTCSDAACGNVTLWLDPKEIEEQKQESQDLKIGLPDKVQDSNVESSNKTSDNMAIMSGTITLYDSKDYSYDFEDGCYMNDGYDDAFDGGYYLYIDDTQYTGSVSLNESDSVVCAEQTMSGMTISREAFVPVTENWARYLNIFTNPTSDPITIVVRLQTNLGSDGGSHCISTSSGDTTFDTSDIWLMTDDTDYGDDPSLGHVFASSHADVNVSDVDCNDGDDNIYFEWNMTVAAGETKIIMNYVIMQPNESAVLEEINNIESNFTQGVYILEISGAESGSIVNWQMDKGIIPRNSGTPFYTTTHNPLNPSTTACLNNMSDGDVCQVTWQVMPTGQHLSSYEFYVLFNSTELPDMQTSEHVRLTINDTDFDDDGINNSVDNCINTVNPDQNDTDDDGVGNVCDNCINDSNSDQNDADNDTMGDECDICPYDEFNDVDEDDVCGDVDNCETTYNPDQNDTDLSTVALYGTAYEDYEGYGDDYVSSNVFGTSGDLTGDTLFWLTGPYAGESYTILSWGSTCWSDFEGCVELSGFDFTDSEPGTEVKGWRFVVTDGSSPGDMIGDACDLCGMTIDSDYNLTADWVCPRGSDGLYIGADNITVNFNGHSITADAYGSDETTGVYIDGYNDVTILDGVVHGFSVGAYLYDTNNVKLSGGNYSNNGPKDNGDTADGWNIYVQDSQYYTIENLESSTPSHSGSGTGWGIGSCPFLYLWNGTKYDYYTDLSGESLGGSWFETNLYESGIYELGKFKATDGAYKLKVREVIPESDFFDEAKLVLVDVPEGYSVLNTWHNTYSDNVAPTKEFITIKEPKAPISAVDDHGANVLHSVSEKDGNPLLNTPNSVVVNFGKINNPEYAKLVISGWSSYELNDGAPSQKNLLIERMDDNGTWHVVKKFGKFTGDLKTFIFDISDILEKDDTKMRITAPSSSTTINVIDQILLDDSAPVDVKVTYLEPDTANLQWGGSTEYSYPTTTHRLTGVADEQHPNNENFLMYGNYTKYGDVTPLLSSTDDMYTVMRHGDELAMEFKDVPQAAKTDRHVFLLADVMYSIKYSVKGYVGDSVEPMPFHGMSKYPYPANESYPTDAEHNAYLAEWNTRVYTKDVSNASESLAATGKTFSTTSEKPSASAKSAETFYVRTPDGGEELRSRDSISTGIMHHSRFGIFVDNSDYGAINDVTLNGNHTTYDEYGIYFYDESDYNTVEDCTINKWSYGIVLDNSWDNTFTDNTVLNNTYEGMYLRVAFYNTITGGEIGNNNQMGDYAGVYLEGSENNTISHVYMHNNKYRAIYLDSYFDGDEWYSDDNTIINNNIDNNCGGTAGIQLYDAYDAIIQDNNVTDGTGYGIYAYEDRGAQILNNNIRNNTYDGIYLYDGSNNTIESNTITENRGAGVYIEDETNDTVRNSGFSSNHFDGLYVESADVDVYNCNFENNGVESEDGPYGIYDKAPATTVNWIIDKKVYCTDNDISIWGNLTFEGDGCIEADNCNILVQNESFDIPTCTVTETQNIGLGGGLPPAQGQTVTIDISSIQGAIENLKVGDVVSFTVNSELHTGTIMSLGTDYVVIWFNSEKVSVTVILGETKQVDLDADGINDVSVTLNSIQFGKADLTFIKLTQPSQAAPAQGVTATSEPVGTTAATPETQPIIQQITSKTEWTTIAIAVVIFGIGAGIALWVIKKK